MHRFIRLLILLVAALILQGCSAVRLSYDHADSLLRWRITDHVDLSQEQDALVRERLVRLHAWHRKTQLPDYVSLAHQARQFVAGRPTVADAQALVDAIIRRGRTLAGEAGADIADFLLTLTTAQIEHIAERFKEKNADFAEEVQLANGESGQRKAQLKRVLERAEYWFGDFSSEQRLALRQFIDGQAIGTRFWYDERLRRQREWIELMRLVQRDRPARDRIIELLHEYVARFDMPGDPARLLQERAWRRNTAELIVAIQAMTTAKQRAHAQHKLGDLIGDFKALSREEDLANGLVR